MHKKHIEIEKMMFGDYRVQVWDETVYGAWDSLLDREYFCHGYDSALLTATGIQESMFKGLPIFFRNGSNLTEIIK